MRTVVAGAHDETPVRSFSSPWCSVVHEEEVVRSCRMSLPGRRPDRAHRDVDGRCRPSAEPTHREHIDEHEGRFSNHMRRSSAPISTSGFDSFTTSVGRSCGTARRSEWSVLRAGNHPSPSGLDERRQRQVVHVRDQPDRQGPEGDRPRRWHTHDPGHGHRRREPSRTGREGGVALAKQRCHQRLDGLEADVQPRRDRLIGQAACATRRSTAISRSVSWSRCDSMFGRRTGSHAGGSRLAAPTATTFTVTEGPSRRRPGSLTRIVHETKGAGNGRALDRGPVAGRFSRANSPVGSPVVYVRDDSGSARYRVLQGSLDLAKLLGTSTTQAEVASGPTSFAVTSIPTIHSSTPSYRPCPGASWSRRLRLLRAGCERPSTSHSTRRRRPRRPGRTARWPPHFPSCWSGRS